MNILSKKQENSVINQWILILIKLVVYECTE